MRQGPLAAVSVTVLLAVSVALAASVGSSKADRPAISRLSYIRDVDHGQPARLGDCPLSQWITMERDGTFLSTWYVERRQNGVCVPVMDFEDASPASEPDAPDVAARSSTRLTPKQVDLLHGKIDRLRWRPEWGAVEDKEGSPTMSSGCENHPWRDDMGHGYDARFLVIERADNVAAALSFFTAREARRAGESCDNAQSGNIALIDAAIAPYVRIMPGAITLPPNPSKLLRPRTVHLTD